MTSHNKCKTDQEVLSILTDQLVECIHCGLCLEACPTYLLIGREEDSPRGRIYLMRQVMEGSTTLDNSVVDHLDVCLGCRACETACPSGVHYGYLLEQTRSRIEDKHQRPFWQRVPRRILLEIFTHSGLLALALFGATLPSRLLRRTPSAPGGLVSTIIGSGHKGGSLLLKEYPPMRPKRIPAFTPAVGDSKMRIGMLEGCVMPVLFHDVNAATVRVLSRLGCDVVVPQTQGCCGALHIHNGYADQAARMALRNIKAFEDSGCDIVLLNSAGCGSTMKEYESLFPKGSENWQRAKAFSAKVRDVSEVVSELPHQQNLKPVDMTVTYHDACHLAHGQKIKNEPRAMLAAIPGLRLVDLPESDLCCGSAGIYSFIQPKIATNLQTRKVTNIDSTNANVVATGNPGCQMWIRSGLLASGSKAIALHPIEIVDMALCSPD